MTWLKIPALSQEIVHKSFKLTCTCTTRSVSQWVLWGGHSHRWGGGSGLWTWLYQDLLFSLAALFVYRGCWQLRTTLELNVEQHWVSEHLWKKLLKMGNSNSHAKNLLIYRQGFQISQCDQVICCRILVNVVTEVITDWMEKKNHAFE